MFLTKMSLRIIDLSDQPRCIGDCCHFDDSDRTVCIKMRCSRYICMTDDTLSVFLVVREEQGTVTNEKDFIDFTSAASAESLHGIFCVSRLCLPDDNKHRLRLHSIPKNIHALLYFAKRGSDHCREYLEKLRCGRLLISRETVVDLSQEFIETMTRVFLDEMDRMSVEDKISRAIVA